MRDDDTAAAGTPAPREAAEAGSTYDRVIDAAEILFAEHGYNGVSIRMIARAAASNIAAISYHFGDKAGLFRAIFERRVRPISEQRTKALEAALACGAVGPADLEALIRSFVAPSVRMIRGDAGAQHFRRLAGRASTDPTPEVRQTIHEVYDAVALRFVEVLRQACPDLPEREFYWRLNFLYGAMLYTNADTGRVQHLAGGGFDSADAEAGIDAMVRFLVAGFAAPPGAVGTDGEKAATGAKRSRARAGARAARARRV